MNGRGVRMAEGRGEGKGDEEVDISLVGGGWRRGKRIGRRSTDWV